MSAWCKRCRDGRMQERDKLTRWIRIYCGGTRAVSIQHGGHSASQRNDAPCQSSLHGVSTAPRSASCNVPERQQSRRPASIDYTWVRIRARVVSHLAGWMSAPRSNAPQLTPHNGHAADPALKADTVEVEADGRAHRLGDDREVVQACARQLASDFSRPVRAAPRAVASDDLPSSTSRRMMRSE